MHAPRVNYDTKYSAILPTIIPTGLQALQDVQVGMQDSSCEKVHLIPMIVLIWTSLKEHKKQNQQKILNRAVSP